MVSPIFKKKYKVGRISLCNFKTLYSYSNPHKEKYRYIDQWNKIENTEIGSHKCDQLIPFPTKVQKQFNGERKLFQQMMLNWACIGTQIDIDLSFTIHEKINPKEIINLNIIFKCIKYLKHSTWENSLESRTR